MSLKVDSTKIPEKCKSSGYVIIETPNGFVPMYKRTRVRLTSMYNGDGYYESVEKAQERINEQAEFELKEYIETLQLTEN